MEKTQVFKKVTEVEGISAEELEWKKRCFCPICGKEEGTLYLPNLICGVCDEHKTVWYSGWATQASLYPLDVFLEMALSIYDHYYIDDKAREMIEGKDQVNLSEVASTIGSIPMPENPMWDGFSAAIRFAKEDRMKREGENSYEAEQKRCCGEYEATGKKVIHIDSYGREVDKDGNLLPKKEIVEDIPSSSPLSQGCSVF
jgi:hypothetical protein